MEWGTKQVLSGPQSRNGVGYRTGIELATEQEWSGVQNRH